jgi:isocitrate dehydrogenase kinase/phosphatase
MGSTMVFTYLLIAAMVLPLTVLSPSHAEIFDVAYWHDVQMVTSGEIIDLIPYYPSRRLQQT